jgi:CDP-6-deoxy-D-xylo-4-hexulose-3-dehydrase
MSTHSRDEILSLAARHGAESFAPKPFVAGKSSVPVSGRVVGAEEVRALVDASLDCWLTTGRFNEKFEKGLANVTQTRRALTVNSGSSANLLAVATLTSAKLGERALKAGDEVLGVAACFPTTVNPQLLYGLVPVFVDVTLPTYNADPALLEEAVGPKTKAIMLAHTLGNPFDLGAVKDLCRRRGLWLIEDSCDALGSTWGGKPVGSFGDLATLSFYPAHHITTGEGGAMLASTGGLGKLAESFRDWGRDCWCAPGADNTCGKRFDWTLGSLPKSYDHKYIYSHLGYNLKITDMQAAIGVAQLERLPAFVASRKANWKRLREGLQSMQDFLILPEATPNSDPSWFGFPLTLREDVPFSRTDLLRYLDEKKIGTRLLFAGNVTRQPYFVDRPHRIVGTLKNTETVLQKTFWLGVYPGLTPEMIDYVVDQIGAFLRTHARVG